MPLDMHARPALDAAHTMPAADLDALMRVAASALAPHSRDRFDLLRDMGATAPELAAVFGLDAERTQAAA